MTSGSQRRVREQEAAVQLYFEGAPLYDDMLAAIATARERIWLESYIFADDEVGRLFLLALADAVRRGVDVRLHLDAAGSLFRTGRRFFREVRHAGIPLRRFHRWSWREPFRYNRRNHCKLLIIDDSCLFTGGFNIHRESDARVVGSACWRDSHAAIHSRSLCEQAEILFDLFWSHRWRDPTRRFVDQAGRQGLALVGNRGPRQEHALRKLYRDALDQAEQRILLTTPYFVPDAKTLLCLRRAARRGVSVHLLLPGVIDHQALLLVARRQYRRLLEAGVRIHEYRQRILHAKTLTVDGELGILGTANFDYRSLFHNYELNLVIRQRGLTEQLDRQFARDLDQSDEITLENLPDPNWRERLLGRAGWVVRRWL
ncbi:phospholipase D-like domain-containing protein [Natronospira bacteriovora]|uniref:Phosphatidylserine/phosphatidylglycerophosphate/ cardiolipin synthase family protein n=1 Tax=Natronospira bacteriovora TaxID=3069753 RepID=A0ABU0W5K3_9GAMM|nr:phosphatidylserine/phosphatidylglycerophosphate/cardiolipin synthase family protein [Natronospira sp. AB-CW4]MDQ2069271.1 phosphatidylserine/phosphatidylglycerophosphate/cardiolipin synthase family protein [Natronospira sp. AB-CW4]